MKKQISFIIILILFNISVLAIPFVINDYSPNMNQFNITLGTLVNFNVIPANYSEVSYTSYWVTKPTIPWPTYEMKINTYNQTYNFSLLGNYNVNFTALGPVGLVTTITWNISVINDTQAPIIVMNPNSNTSLNQGDIILVNCSAVDNVEVKRVLADVDGITICEGINSCSVNYVADTVGINLLTCTSEDISGNVNSQSAPIFVSASPSGGGSGGGGGSSSSIIFNSYYPENLSLIMDEGTSQLFIVNASDLDNDTLSYYWYLNDTLLPLYLQNNYILNINTTQYPTEYTLRTIVSDGQSNSSMEWNITVNDINFAPGAGKIAPGASIEIYPYYYLMRNSSCGIYTKVNITNHSFQFLSNITDIEHDNLIIDWSVLKDNILLFNEHKETPWVADPYGYSTFPTKFNYTFNQVGTYIINISVDDDQYNKYPNTNKSQQRIVNVFDNNSIANTAPTMVKYIIPSNDLRFDLYKKSYQLIDVYSGYYIIKNSTGAELNIINTSNNVINFIVNATDVEQDNLLFNWYVSKDNISIYSQQQYINYSTTQETSSNFEYQFLYFGVYIVNVSVDDNKPYTCSTGYTTKQWLINRICTPNWILNDTWSQCYINDLQNESYYDSNNCDDDSTKPADLTQNCTYIAPSIPSTGPSGGSNRPSLVTPTVKETRTLEQREIQEQPSSEKDTGITGAATAETGTGNYIIAGLIILVLLAIGFFIWKKYY
ncbi:hypothetical protein J4427_03260 [Candidatus Woesearchaeota archaeon]|nr:hypothetical protein [Candidatus Woesearchaeota archaeon]